jgi:hypothetical protein
LAAELGAEPATGLADEPPPQAARPSNAAAQNAPVTSARMPIEVCWITMMNLLKSG